MSVGALLSRPAIEGSFLAATLRSRESLSHCVVRCRCRGLWASTTPSTTGAIAQPTVTAFIACFSALLIGVYFEPPRQRDALALQIHFNHSHLHDVPGLHDLARILHIRIRQRGDMNQPVLVHADIY